MGNNSIKSAQLGMSLSTANNRLRKLVLYHMVCLAGMNTCYRCGGAIVAADDLSIEHMVPWLHSADPARLFFDLENISFSHPSCNSAAKRHAFRANSKSGLKGVYFEPKHRERPWRAQYSHKNKRHTIGFFSTKEQAARAYDQKVLNVFGDRAVTNESLGLLE